MGKRSSGSMISRLRVRNDMAAKKVPLTTNAHVPSAETINNWEAAPRDMGVGTQRHFLRSHVEESAVDYQRPCPERRDDQQLVSSTKGTQVIKHDEERGHEGFQDDDKNKIS